MTKSPKKVFTPQAGKEELKSSFLLCALAYKLGKPTELFRILLWRVCCTSSDMMQLFFGQILIEPTHTIISAENLRRYLWPLTTVYCIQYTWLSSLGKWPYPHNFYNVLSGSEHILNFLFFFDCFR